MVYAQIRSHLERVTYQAGRPLQIASRPYRLRGYFANKLATTMDHEPHFVSVLQRILASREGAFIDVGTNLGQTLIKVLAIEPARRYVGFEPQISCCFFIEQFIRDNGLTNAAILPIALSDANRMCALFSSSANDEMASIAGAVDATGAERPSKTWVAARVGDEALGELELDGIAAIKIDVEGAELSVMRGLAKTFARYKPTVLFEVLPNFYGHERVMLPPDQCVKNREMAAGIYGLLREAGYVIKQIHEDGSARAIERFELDDVTGYVGFNYLAEG